MRAPHVRDLSGVDAVVYGIPFDTATSYRTGARFGPEAIRSASALIRPYHPVLDVNVVEKLSIVDYGDLPVSPGDTERTYAQVQEALVPVIGAGAFPVAMGGDHSVTLAELRALAQRHGPLALVLLDAHADTWDAYFGQKYFHGTTFKRAVEEGLLDARASVLAGMRGAVYAAGDLELARDLGFTVVESEDLRALGPARYGELVREQVESARSSARSTSTSSTRPSHPAPEPPRSPASRPPRRLPSCVPCAASIWSAATSSKSRRPTTPQASRPLLQRRMSSSSFLLYGRSHARRSAWCGSGGERRRCRTGVRPAVRARRGHRRGGTGCRLPPRRV